MQLPAVESGQAATTSDRRQQASLTSPRRSPENTPADAKPVPVVAATVHQGSVPVYISGLGTVQALYTINIKAQVDGVILKMPFAEGQDVKEGDTLVLIDPSVYQAKLEQAQAQKQRATAQLENAKTNLWRDEELLKHDFATQKQTDQERMLVGQYTADIAQYDADIKYWQAELAYTNIRSPINGRIGIRNVDPGNLIRAQDNNTTLVTLVQLQPISVIITVPAKELARNKVSLGLVNLPVTAYAENGVTPLGHGQVHTVNVEVEQTTGTIKLKAEFNNEQYKLWPGDFVDCKIVVEQRDNGLTVPTAAIRHGPRGDFVWVIQPDNIVAIRPIRVRQTVGGTAVIDTGLDANEKIVLDGYARLAQGSRVEIVPPRSGDGSRVSRVE
ncbi:MAG: efflux RND transporter periplasmic adaptor subunit [Xanthobacteraceae bacterium]